MMNTELGQFIQALQELINQPDDVFTDESVEMMKEQMDGAEQNSAIQNAIYTIIENFEKTNVTKSEAKEAIDSLKDYFNQIFLSELNPEDNRYKVTTHVLGIVYNVLDKVVDQYHKYNFEMPITLDEGAYVPTYAHEDDAAADLYALEETVIQPHELGRKVRTGVHIQLPENWVAYIIPRSSIGAKTPLRLSNSVGCIDQGYRGELGVLYDNISEAPYTINAGDRIAQLLVMPCYRFKANVVDSLEDSERGSTGFGDSGK